MMCNIFTSLFLTGNHNVGDGMTISFILYMQKQ